MTFAHPYFLLLLLVLPLLAYWKRRRGQESAFLYSSVQLVKNVSDISRSAAARILPAMRWLSLICCIVGLARPQFTESETTVNASGIDIVIAVDLSGSMESEDFRLRGEQVNRLVIAKDTVKKFILKRPNDRIGLVAFAGKAYIAAPLTLDHDFLVSNLGRLALHTVEEGTPSGLGYPLRLSSARSEIEKQDRDPDDGRTEHAGKNSPPTAAEAAKTLGVEGYSIRGGTPGMPPCRNFFSAPKLLSGPGQISKPPLAKIPQKRGEKFFAPTPQIP